MLCSQYHLRRQDNIGVTVKLLPCRNWHCEYCQPNRLKQLRAMAASGDPNTCLTLTVNVATGENIVERYKLLHNAWKILAKRIMREFLKPPKRRWIIHTEDGYEYQEPKSYRNTKKVAEGSVDRLHYMAFPEETEKHQPHLHILLRTKYIPQRWISEQMKELINSPIVWIEKIKGARGAIAYVTKYVTTAPAQFGKSKRYWCSRFYQLRGKEVPKNEDFSRKNSQLVQQPFSELIREIVTTGRTALPINRTEIKLLTIRELQRKQGTDTAEAFDQSLMSSYLWIHRWRQECRV